MESHSGKPVEDGMINALRSACQQGSDWLTLDEFIETALYHPQLGYYKRIQNRVGRHPESDFYTASSMGPTFARLVVEAITRLLDAPLEEYVFVEAGPESDSGILGNIDSSPFQSIKLIRPGDPFKIPSRSVVFSNELFDAQPFRRLVYMDSKWREMGVRINQSQLEWVVLDLQDPIPELPVSVSEGYIIDWPGRANSLLEEIADQPWTGLFIAFDYGLDSPTVFHERPQGTGRTYSNHKMGNDLLQRPGEIDLTCHIIWDVMENILQSRNFTQVQLHRQEAFFMKNAQKEIQRIMETGAPGFSREKQSLMELIHPGNMGHQFHVLSARRTDF